MLGGGADQEVRGCRGRGWSRQEGKRKAEIFILLNQPHPPDEIFSCKLKYLTPPFPNYPTFYKQVLNDVILSMHFKNNKIRDFSNLKFAGLATWNLFLKIVVTGF